MKKKLKGFTLIELIIVIALFAMLLAMIGGLFKPIAGLFAMSKRSFGANVTTQGIVDYITGNLKYAVSVQIYTNYDSQPMHGPDNSTDPYVYCMQKAGLNPTDFNHQKRFQRIIIYNGGGTAGDKADAWEIDPVSYVGRVYREKGFNTGEFQALGFGFYGPQDYRIDLTGRKVDSTGITTEESNSSTLYVTVDMRKHSDLDESDGGTAYGSTSFLNTSAEVKNSGTGNNHYIYFVLPE